MISINARGIANEKKRRALFDFHRTNADILVILESHSSPECEKIWENEWGGRAIFAHGTSASRGIAIMFKKRVYEQVFNITRSVDGRYVIFDFKEEDKMVSVVALYAPNEDCPEFFRELALLLRERHEHKIIVGDFNLALDPELDRKNTYCNNNKARDIVLDLMDEFCLKDIWRVRNGDRKEYSWTKKLKTGEDRKASRIDFALMSAGLDHYLENIMYLSSIMTDHRGIYLVLDLVPNDRGPGYWKFNNMLLQNAEFINFMNEELERTIQSSCSKNPVEKWEIVKTRVKKATKKFSRQNSSVEKITIANLSEKVNEYESNLPLPEDEDRIYQETKADLEEKQMLRVAGVMFRSKAKWYESGERNTKYFYSLEKAKYNAKTCYKLVDETNQKEECEPKKILELQKTFYQQLYSVDKDVSFCMTNSFGVTVPEEVKATQELQLNISDITSAIKGMNNNKTPGEDGIPIDFYKVFWGGIKDVFMDMVAYCYESKKLHPTARRGILNLIPKQNKDTRYIKNLRPITLLNTDYKIIEKAIANKILPALEHIIHKDQRGFMKDRRISVNIRKMLDIMNYAQAEDLEAVVLSLDFVKCFDKCSFSVLHGSLAFFWLWIYS